MSSYTLNVGKIGEDVATNYLKKHDFEVIERNYRELGGEIDIIAKKEDSYHFVEVKARSKGRDSGDLLPQEAVDERKQRKIINTAKNYLRQKHLQPDDTVWQIDVIAVIIEWAKRNANVRYYPRAVTE